MMCRIIVLHLYLMYSYLFWGTRLMAAEILPDSPALQGTEGEHPHLYLEFGKKADDLRRQLAQLKGIHGTGFLPAAGPGEDILHAFVELVFPEPLSGSYCLCNTSLKEGFPYLTIRPTATGPRLEEGFPGGLIPCVHGNPSPPGGPSPVLIVNGIAMVAPCPPRPFEQDRTVIPFWLPANVYPFSRRSHDLLTPDFVKSLPPISLITGQRLADWRGYLGWRRTLIQSTLAGFRYVEVTLGRNLEARFVAVAENEAAFERFRVLLARQGLEAYQLGYSLHPPAQPEPSGGTERAGEPLRDRARRGPASGESGWHPLA